LATTVLQQSCDSDRRQREGERAESRAACTDDESRVASPHTCRRGDMDGETRRMRAKPKAGGWRRRKLDVMRAISARRVQKAWRRKLGWIRARRAEGVALMLAMRWKRKLVLKKEHLRLGAAHVVEFITQLQSQQAVVTKFKEFYKNGETGFSPRAPFETDACLVRVGIRGKTKSDSGYGCPLENNSSFR
jgi:hypothetical protein